MLARRRAHLEHSRLRRLAGDGVCPPDADLDPVRERCADLLRPESVGLRLREALDLYLDASSREIDAEIEARRERSGEPAAGFEGAMAEERDPAERGRLLSAWGALERALEPARFSRGEQRRDAARAAGGRDVAGLRERSLGVPLRDLLDEGERRAIAPLDEAIARASRAASRVPDLGTMGFPPLRRLAAGAGEDPDVRGPRLLQGLPACWRTAAVCPPGERAWLVVGARTGLDGGLDALEGVGIAIRATLVSRERGEAALAAEHPAWSRAAGTLFRRLGLDERIRANAGWPRTESVEQALRLDAAVAPRIAWANASSSLGPEPPEEAPARFRRATGREAFPGIRAAAWDRDPAEAAGWLGTIWALLLEERLLTRWGRAWHDASGAVSWLRDVWLAEPDSDPGAMASQAGVGTMTPDAVLEACRPTIRVP